MGKGSEPHGPATQSSPAAGDSAGCRGGVDNLAKSTYAIRRR